jgi:hypothetical protein
MGVSWRRPQIGSIGDGRQSLVISHNVANYRDSGYSLFKMQVLLCTVTIPLEIQRLFF